MYQCGLLPSPVLHDKIQAEEALALSALALSISLSSPLPSSSFPFIYNSDYLTTFLHWTNGAHFCVGMSLVVL